MVVGDGEIKGGGLPTTGFGRGEVQAWAVDEGGTSVGVSFSQRAMASATTDGRTRQRVSQNLWPRHLLPFMRGILELTNVLRRRLALGADVTEAWAVERSRSGVGPCLKTK